MPRKEEKDKRSAVKNLFWARLQILRHSAPQNDKLFLNCELIPLRGLDFGCALDGLRLGHARTSSE